MSHYNAGHMEMGMSGEEVISRVIKPTRGMQGGKDEHGGREHSLTNCSGGAGLQTPRVKKCSPP